MKIHKKRCKMCGEKAIRPTTPLWYKCEKCGQKYFASVWNKNKPMKYEKIEGR